MFLSSKFEAYKSRSVYLGVKTTLTGFNIMLSDGVSAEVTDPQMAIH